MKENLENRIRLLEEKVLRLSKENCSISKILIEKVKPVCDDWEIKNNEKIKEHELVMYD